MSAGDVLGSAAQGAAAGSTLGPGGTVVGGLLGLFSGIGTSKSKKDAEKAEKKAIAREKAAAVVRGESREEQMLLNSLTADRQRREFSQQAFLTGETIKAGTAISGLTGSSIARVAQASVKQQKGSNLQFSFLTEELGERISNLMQEAEDIRYGITRGETIPEVPSAPTTEIDLGDEDDTQLFTEELDELSITFEQAEDARTESDRAKVKDIIETPSNMTDFSDEDFSLMEDDDTNWATEYEQAEDARTESDKDKVKDTTTNMTDFSNENYDLMED